MLKYLQIADSILSIGRRSFVKASTSLVAVALTAPRVLAQYGARLPWKNWSGNIVHNAPINGEDYYFYPRNLIELQKILSDASARGVTVRATGQRHSQTPLVAKDNRNEGSNTTLSSYLVDMSCYVDIGDEGIELGPGPNQITVNPGVREDSVDAFLSRNDLMFRTVTAGGFFSIGGMTAVDVHGGTVAAPIFAETASAFTILGADGELVTIDAQTPAFDGWSPLQFARVSLGALGIVTRITLDVEHRPYATSVSGSRTLYKLTSKNEFVAQFRDLVVGPNAHDRLEVFYTPYAAAENLPFLVPKMDNFLVLGWNVIDDPTSRVLNADTRPPTACQRVSSDEFGAPVVGGLANYGLPIVHASQYVKNAYSPIQNPPIPPSAFAKIGMNEIESQFDAANGLHSDLWLSEAAQVMFMSYFVELPNLDTEGLGKIWDGLEVVARRTISDGEFHIAAPMEFRLIKGGNSAMSGTYSQNPDAIFVNLDLIGFIDPVPSAEYNSKLLKFFSEVERDWVAMGGFPHNGKMYGFYDPAAPGGTYSAAFNPNYLATLRQRRGQRLQVFNDYRKTRDPGSLFYNDYLRELLEG